MESTAHTPGPWGVERCDVTPCYHVEAGAWPLGSHICEVGEQPREGNAEANARLIASAPALLAALIAVTDELERIAIPEDQIGKVRHQARAAIAQATPNQH